MTRDQLIALLALGQRAEDLLSSIRVLQDLSEPSKVENVSASNNGSTNTLTWDEAVGAPRISHYVIRRDGVEIDTDTDSPYEDSDLANGTYSYTVAAVDGNGREGPESAASQATVNVTAPAPDVPISFLASATSATGISLTWTAGPLGPAPTDYDLDFATAGANGPWTNIASVGLQTSFAHTARTTATQYWYRLLALNGVVPALSYATATEITDGPSQVAAANFIIPATTADVTWSGTTARVPEEGGAARPVRPGDIIELESGNHGRLTLSNIVGSASNRITIRGPATGRAVITANSGTSHLLNLNNLRHVNIDGQSQTASVDADGKRRNIRVSYTGSGDPVHLVKFGGGGSGYNQTRNIAIRYVEVVGNWDGVSQTGGRIAIGTNGSYTAADFPSAWQEHMIFEHLYVHNVRTEGMYCGANPYKSVRGDPPPGRDVPNRYIKIRYSRFTLCGGNALDLKSWFDGQSGIDQFPTTLDLDTNNSIHDCEFFRCGTDDDPSANPPNSPTVSLISVKAAFYNNTIEAGGGRGLNIFTDAGTDVNFPGGVSTDFTQHVFNNRIRGCGVNISASGIIVGVGNTNMTNAYRPNAFVFNNTVISNNGDGIIFNTGAKSTGFGRNNIVLGNTDTPIVWGPVTNENSKNLISGTPGSVLVDVTGTFEAGTLNFNLLSAQSVASGSVLGTDVATTDFDGDTRVLGTADKGAHEF